MASGVVCTHRGPPGKPRESERKSRRPEGGPRYPCSLGSMIGSLDRHMRRSVATKTLSHRPVIPVTDSGSSRMHPRLRHWEDLEERGIPGHADRARESAANGRLGAARKEGQYVSSICFRLRDRRRWGGVRGSRYSGCARHNSAKILPTRVSVVFCAFGLGNLGNACAVGVGPPTPANLGRDPGADYAPVDLRFSWQSNQFPPCF